MMMNLLAEVVAGGGDTMISGDWTLKLIAAIFTGAALVLGRYWGKKEESAKLTLPNPMPEMPFRKVDRAVSFDQHSALDARVARIENHLDRIERDGAMQYKQILESGSERELRMTTMLMENLREVHNRLDVLIKNSPPTTPRR